MKKLAILLAVLSLLLCACNQSAPAETCSPAASEGDSTTGQQTDAEEAETEQGWETPIDVDDETGAPVESDVTADTQPVESSPVTEATQSTATNPPEPDTLTETDGGIQLPMIPG